MVEQRSPKPLVACSNRVSPATNTFGCFFIARFLRKCKYIIPNNTRATDNKSGGSLLTL